MTKSYTSQSGAPHTRVWQVHDDPQKPQSPSRCTQCGVLYAQGHWQWHADSLGDEHPTICPACLQINRHQAAAELTLSGDYFTEHREHILQLLHRQSEYETQEHPLHRIISINNQPKAALISFTDVHSPKRIAHAIEKAHPGTLKIDYDDRFCRAHWYR